MKYLKKFNTLEEYNAFAGGSEFKYPNVSLVGANLIYVGEYTPTPEYDVPLYIEAIEPLTVKISTSTIEYSLDNNQWVSLPAGTNTPTINAGEKVYFRATGLYASSYSGIGTFTVSALCNVGGNIMSMMYGDNFSDTSLVMKSDFFQYLFKSNTKIVSAKSLALPAISIATQCYAYMFYGCTGLVDAPALPATTLGNFCYKSMFYGCTSLINAPALPATTLASSCYDTMFYGCTSLINAPALPATTLVFQCYNSMFYGCKSLVDAPALPATTLAGSCYKSMFYNCTSLINAPALPATTLTSDCYQSMFYGCTSLVDAPALPATTLASNCYSTMFRGCRSLKNAPALPATTLAANCYGAMFRECVELEYAPELPAITLIENCYQYMFYQCYKLSSIKALFLTTPSSSYTSNWVVDVKSSGTFVKNSEATWNVTGYNAIPSGWTVELAAA